MWADTSMSDLIDAIYSSGSTTIRTQHVSYTRHFVHKPKPNNPYKNEIQLFVQKRNQTFRTIYIIQFFIIT